MLMKAALAFSPQALQASLQTSTFQARNRTTGVVMSLHKQSDVKNHLSPQYRTKIHVYKPLSGTVGLSADEPDAIKAVRLGFAEDFLAEHSSGEAPASTGLVTGSVSSQATTVSKNARA